MFKIDLQESFPHLARAPIVEAVIEMRARAEVPWTQESLSAHLQDLFTEYPKKQAQNEFKAQVKFGALQGAEAKREDLGFKGLRLFSKDAGYLAQFNRDSFALSRLQPYESWEKFVDEAFRLWTIHNTFAKVSEVSRFGLRYINKIPLGNNPNVEHYIEPHPTTPRGLEGFPFYGFLHQSTLGVPGHPYVINTVTTIEKVVGAQFDFALILDIDVSVEQAFEADPEKMRKTLGEMRWLKNKVFFGTITADTLKSLQ